MAGMRRPAAPREFGRFTLRYEGCRLAHVVSSRVRYPRWCADCATGVQGDVLVFTTVTHGCSFHTAAIPPSRLADVVQGMEHARPSLLMGWARRGLAHRWLCSAPLRRCTATGGSRRSREDMGADPRGRRRTASASGSRSGPDRHAPPQRQDRQGVQRPPPGCPSVKQTGHRGLGQHRYGHVTGRTRSRSSIEECRISLDVTSRWDDAARATDRGPGGGQGPDRQRGAEAPRAPRSHGRRG